MLYCQSGNGYEELSLLRHSEKNEIKKKIKNVATRRSGRMASRKYSEAGREQLTRREQIISVNENVETAMNPKHTIQPKPGRRK